MIKAIVDRIENNLAILEIKDKYIQCDLSLLPENVSEGDILNIEITINNEERKEREEKIKRLQNKLKNRNL